jgi:Protein of unknown function (DUF1499)
MIWALFALFILLAGFATYVRLAPHDPARWQLSGPVAAVGDHAEAGGFTAARAFDGELEDVAAVLLATPRTRELGTWDGQRLYVTRSALWGFPDYTTVRVEDGQLEIYGRLRFGKSDLGVNQARIRGWLTDLNL